jgi:hypothetical protein
VRYDDASADAEHVQSIDTKNEQVEFYDQTRSISELPKCENDELAARNEGTRDANAKMRSTLHDDDRIARPIDLTNGIEQ